MIKAQNTQTGALHFQLCNVAEKDRVVLPDRIAARFATSVNPFPKSL